MDIQIAERGAFSSALVKLERGEQFVSEAGAMYRASSNIDIDVTTRTRETGGLLSGVKRWLAAESFFFSKYTCGGAEPGEVGLAPTLQGELAVIECSGARSWLCAGGSYLGSTPELDIDTQFQGLKGLFTGESFSFVKVSGVGRLLVNAFGHLHGKQVSGALTVDTGHVVAFEDSLGYTLGKAGGSWIQSYFAGEGIVLNFTGHGQVLLQSHNPKEFGRRVGPLLPPREK